ncbi:MAG: TatD family hydrolase [Prevotellaceae bacterium]|jgi:TatD DNase family protein|nr:TatD family hydrolase [Prevotellaceae bacterium]
MTDTHAHLYDEQFDADRDEMIQRAVANGVSAIVVPSTDSTNHNAMMQLCRRYPDICYPAVGLHPTSVNENWRNEIAEVEKCLKSDKYTALGEIGIDCYWSMDWIEQQREVFDYQLKLAENYGLPVIIHARNAFHEIFSILDRVHNERIKGVFHSFSGSCDDYFKIKEYGTFKIGIGGAITFKNSSLPQVVYRIPISDLVLETDAPYLTPHPYRGKRNESSYIPLIAQKIAAIKNLSIETVDEITSENARQLFVVVSGQCSACPPQD